MFNPVTYYRLARWLYLHRIPLLPRLVEILNVLVFHCYVPYTVEIGDGFEVGYWGIGVVIHPRVKIGKNVSVFIFTAKTDLAFALGWDRRLHQLPNGRDQRAD